MFWSLLMINCLYNILWYILYVNDRNVNVMKLFSFITKSIKCIILSKMFPLNLFSFPLPMFRCFYFFVFAHIIVWWKHIIMDNNLIIIDIRRHTSLYYCMTFYITFRHILHSLILYGVAMLAGAKGLWNILRIRACVIH